MSENSAAGRTAPARGRADAAWPQLAIEFETQAGRGLRISPRQIELLVAVRRHGSISGAARSLGVSFRGAWLMLENMERCVGCELLLRNVGGRGGGGAALNAHGDELLKLVSQVQSQLQDGLDRIRGD